MRWPLVVAFAAGCAAPSVARMLRLMVDDLRWAAAGQAQFDHLVETLPADQVRRFG